MTSSDKKISLNEHGNGQRIVMGFGEPGTLRSIPFIAGKQRWVRCYIYYTHKYKHLGIPKHLIYTKLLTHIKVRPPDVGRHSVW